MEPLYNHDCDKCTFLGTWRKNPDCDAQQDFDLYVCESFTNLPSTNCLARFSNDGPDYSSMTLENRVWDESLAAHDAGKDRPSMYLCWMPELLECWRRWKDRQWKAAYLDHFSVGSAGVPIQRMESEEKERMHTFHPNPDYEQKAKESSEEAEVLGAHVGLLHVVHDQVSFDMPIRGMESDEARKAILELRKLTKNTPYWPTVTGRTTRAEPEMQFFPPQGEKAKRQEPNTLAMDIDYRDLELRILTADGYTFTEQLDGSIGDGDLSWPSLQAFLDSRRDGTREALERLAATEMSEEEIVAEVRESRSKIDERIMRIDTVRRALLAAANLSREESRDMTTQEVADDVLNQLMEGEFDG